MKQTNHSNWFYPDQAEAADKWIRTELEKQGMQVTGSIDSFYARPWSIVMRVPASSGVVYFKAVFPELRHEIALSQALWQWQPECTLPVLAADVRRGWLLLPDGGMRLREIIRSSRDFRHWQTVLPAYARLQIDIARRVNEMLSFSEPDRRLIALPEQYEMLLEDQETLRIDQKDGISSEEFQRLKKLKPHFARICAELEDYGIPETLNHGDLTDGNIFIQAGRPIFFDWGDSAVSHPFFSLRTIFVSLYFSLEIDTGAPELDILRDIYLDAWKEYGTLEQLKAAFRLAQQLAPVSGALAWQRVVSRLEDAEKEEYRIPVPALLQEFLEFVEAK